MHRIVSLVRLWLPRSISFHMTPLHQYCSHACDRSITVNYKIIDTLWQSENRCLAQPLFEHPEGFLLLRSPAKNHRLLGQSGQRNCNIGVVQNKYPVIPYQTQETLNISWRSENLPLYNDLYLGQINQNTLLVDKIPKELHLAQPELTLGELRKKSLPP